MIGAAFSDFLITDCGSATVEAKGSETGNLVSGDLLVYIGDGSSICSSCTPLFRKITSVSDGSIAGSKIYNTTFATVAEIYGSEFYDSSIAGNELEPLFGCLHSNSSINRRELSKQVDAVVVDRTLQSFPSSCSNWQAKNSVGRCTYTDCFVGTTGDAVDCFYCKTGCDNGCGAAGSLLNPPDSFVGYDFGEACCIHDFCYSSNFAKDVCDKSFLEDMNDACPDPLNGYFLNMLFPLRSPPCPLAAYLYYLAVKKTEAGDNAYSDAQNNQALYKLTAACDLCANVTCENPIEGCDPFDGNCKPKDSAVPCIAIIDESDNFSDADIEAKWANFRDQYPDRPFCLLQPLYSSYSSHNG